MKTYNATVTVDGVTVVKSITTTASLEEVQAVYPTACERSFAPVRTSFQKGSFAEVYWATQTDDYY